jgi:hypothetical protein
MAPGTQSPLAAAADLLGSLFDQVDPDKREDLEEMNAALESMKRSLASLEADLAASLRADTRKRLTLVDGEGDDA